MAGKSGLSHIAYMVTLGLARSTQISGFLRREKGNLTLVT